MGRNGDVVAIIGRANVGKSTLFNRIVQKRLAIVDDIPGVTETGFTREWNGQANPFTLSIPEVSPTTTNRS